MFFLVALYCQNKINIHIDCHHFFLQSTPLIKLNKLSESTGCTIAVKAEFMNPGGSVKDRAALYLIKDALEKGQFVPMCEMIFKGVRSNYVHVCGAERSWYAYYIRTITIHKLNTYLPFHVS